MTGPLDARGSGPGSSVGSQPPPRNVWTNWVAPAAVLAVGLALTVVQYSANQQAQTRLLETRFELRASDLVARVEQRMALYEQALRGTRGLFEASDRVERREFATYVTSLDLAHTYPGVQGIGFAVVLRPDEREAHVAQVRREVPEPLYELRPGGERSLYTSIVYLEPFRDRNLRAFGYDMSTEPVRRAALEQARDADAATITGKVRLVQETETDVQPGFLMYLPVYRNGSPRASVEARRANLLGWVYAPFRSHDLMAGIRGPQYGDLQADLFDGTEASSENLLHSTRDPSGPAPTARFEALRTLRMLNRSWTLRVTSRPQFERQLSVAQSTNLPLAGLAATLLAALLTRQLLRGRARALTLAHAMTRELRESEQRFRLMADAAPVLIWTAGTDTRCDYFNARWLDFTGRTLEQEVGEGWAQGVHPDDAPRCLETYITAFHARRTFSMEYRLRRADGSWGWLLDIGVPRAAPDGAFAGYIGSCIDITAMKEVEQTLALKHEQLEALNASLEVRVRDAVADVRTRDQLLITQARHAAMGDMIGNIAHQWRQPLNALGLVLTNLRDASRFGELDAPTLEKAVEDGHRLIQKMSSTINVFRDFLRPDKPRASFSALAQVRATVELVAASFREAGVTLHVEADADPTLFGSANEYSQVLLNLLSNAKQALVAANVTDRVVTVRLCERDGLACLSVRDNGVGIPDELLERIFEPYFSTKEGGTGIGLYMSRQIVERSFGGRLEARNVDGGAELTALTPLAPS